MLSCIPLYASDVMCAMYMECLHSGDRIKQTKLKRTAQMHSGDRIAGLPPDPSSPTAAVVEVRRGLPLPTSDSIPVNK